MATKTKAKGPAIVLLHGLGGCEDDWAEVAAALGKTHDVSVPKLPWSGRDPEPSKGCDPISGAAYLARELASRKGECVAFGHAFGARVLGELLESRPAGLVGAGLVSPLGTVKYSFTSRMKWKGMSRASVLRNVSDSSMKNAASYGFTEEGAGKKKFVERALAFRSGPKAETMMKVMEEGVDGLLEAPPLVERLKGTTIPLLIVAGSEDPLAEPGDSRELLKTRKDARFELLDGAGHYPMIEDPKGIAKLLASFAAEI